MVHPPLGEALCEHWCFAIRGLAINMSMHMLSNEVTIELFNTAGYDAAITV